MHAVEAAAADGIDRKSTRLNSSHMSISYAVFCLKKTIVQPVGHQPPGQQLTLRGHGRMRNDTAQAQDIPVQDDGQRGQQPGLVQPPVFFFNDTATTEIYTLSLHDALPIFARLRYPRHQPARGPAAGGRLLLQDLHVDRKSTRLNSSHMSISYAVFCLK